MVQIGTGGSSRVYRAHQSVLDRVVAVKVIGSGHDPDVARRFDRERKAMGRLSNHEGIVPVYSTGLTAQGDPYLVMPYYPSGSLQNQIDAGPMPWQIAVSYVQAAARTIAAAHAAGVVHLDLKPANILLTKDGSPRIADFGIAKLTSTNSTARTTGTAFTPAYSAPETFLDGEASPAADVYGLGATLWALLVGHPPFLTPGDDANLMAVIGRVVNNTVGDISHLAPEPVCQVVYTALAKQPGQRFATAADFSAALSQAIDATDGHGSGFDTTKPVTIPTAAAASGVNTDKTRLFANQPPLIPSARTIGPGPTPVMGAATAGRAMADDPFATSTGGTVATAYPPGGSPPYGYGSGGEPGRSRSLLQPEHEVAPHAVAYSEPPEERHPLLEFDRFQVGPVVVGLLALIGVGLLSIWAFTRESGSDTAVSEDAAVSQTDPASPTVDADSSDQDALDISGSVDPDANTTNDLIAGGTDDATASSAPTTTTGRTTSTAVATTVQTTATDATTSSDGSSTTSTTEATSSSSTSSTTSSTTSTSIAGGGELSPPGNLSGSYADGVVTLSWQVPSSGSTPIAYAVYRDGEMVNTTPSSPFVDDTAEPGSHNYRVASIGSDSAQSDLTSAIVVEVPDDEPAPFAVTVSQTGARRAGIDVEVASSDCMASYRLSWTGPNNSDSIRQTFEDGQCVTTMAESINGLRPDTTYTVSVVAVHADGSQVSDQVEASTD